MQLAEEQEKDLVLQDYPEDLVEVQEKILGQEALETRLLKLHLPQEQGKVILEDQGGFLEDQEIQELVAAEAAVSAALEQHHLIIMAEELAELVVMLGLEIQLYELEAAVDPEQVEALVDLKITVDLVDLAEVEPEQDMVVYPIQHHL
jgi:hypothetical protein